MGGTHSREGGTRRAIALPPLMLDMAGSDGRWGIDFP